MATIIGGPARYIQGRGELKNLGKHIEKFGKNVYILISKNGKERFGSTIEENLKAAGLKAVFDIFKGECSQKEIERVKSEFEKNKSDVIVAVGGGKILDTAKAVADYLVKPAAIVPTIASTDAPCSALSVIYSDDGVFEKYLFTKASPNVVLVDSDIISQAPARLIVSGMGDALATYFEALSAYRSTALNCLGGNITKSALALAKLCYETLLESGYAAKLAVEQKVCTKAVEDIIEANTYLSGIGFESGGLAAAHSVHNGLTAIPETHQFYHGEKVAFGTITQLVLEGESMDLINEVICFCKSVGLPTTFADLNVKKIDKNQLMEVAKIACASAEPINSLYYPVSPEAIYAAMLGADAIGRNYMCPVDDKK
ncbi:MAG: glycerol dehydrogenase [Elusimicrobiota bacterium]|jgi:glycerol dehydrogenase|nr:glycerol dehydrogenase [Elusimicrobiota bacterium]